MNNKSTNIICSAVCYMRKINIRVLLTVSALGSGCLFPWSEGMAANGVDKYLDIDATKSNLSLEAFNGWYALASGTNGTALELPTYSYDNSENRYRCRNADMCVFVETRVGGGLGQWLFWKWQAGIDMNGVQSVTATGDDGNTVTLDVSTFFAQGAPVVTWFQKNTNQGGSDEERPTTSDTLSNYFTPPAGQFVSREGQTNGTSWTGDWAQSAWLRCGNSQGCGAISTTFLNPKSGKLSVSVKLKKGKLSPGQVYTFNAKVMTLKSNQVALSDAIGNGEQSRSVSLWIKGMLRLPKRCYLSSGNGTIAFSQVHSGATNGHQETKSYSVSSACYGIEGTVKQYLTVDRASQDNTLQGEGDYKKTFVNTSDGKDAALSLIMSIVPQKAQYGHNTSCNSFSGDYLNTFGKNHHIRDISALADSSVSGRQTFTDTIYLDLCKYGIPASSGIKTIPLKITSRWEQQ